MMAPASQQKGDERRGLHAREPCDFRKRRIFTFERQIHHLTADHSAMTGGGCELRYQLAAHERIAVRLRRADQPKGECQ